MISKVLIVISTLVILVGLFGIRSNRLQKRMLFLCISQAGSILLAFVGLNAYGLLGGIFQILFRLLSLILLFVFFGIYKRGQILSLSDIRGMGRQTPYLFAAAVVMAMIVIGIPATGTFTGILYSEIGLLSGGYGVFTYIGLAANMAGIIVAAMLLVPVFRRAYFPGVEKGGPTAVKEEDVPEPADEGNQAGEQLPAGGRVTICYLVAAFLLVVFCIYQQPVMTLATELLGKVFE